MIDFSKRDIDKLTKLISKELELFEKYLSETMAQTEYIEFDDDEGLTSSIEEQTRISEEIDKLHSQTAPMIKAYRASLVGKKPDETSAIEKAALRIRTILKESSEINAANIKAANEKKTEYSEHISKIAKGKKGLSGYTQQLTDTSDLFDKKQ